ncbi:hypothetical protein PNOK_0001000 [Pyrrhoderma noxium]|uniref:Uncharacterized protein n=1 Tax=Pyrrhoderma noxium TaxID=2282107 RepID=A0A286UTL4_9AGAM|nr:hypothetical protein PNOK_0001000 [Pyrrhoderma noxium]
MGNNSSKMSDLFYPDNPNRRARASQLRDDVVSYCNEFKDVRRHRDEVLKELGPRLGKFLKKYGYNSPEELDKMVKDTLKGPALSEYLQVSKEVDKDDVLVSTIFQITSFISIGSGIFFGGLVLLGVMTGGAALAAIGAVGGIIAIFGVFVALFEVFEGERERTNMRKCINDLSVERVKARAALEGMKAISNWVEKIKMWLDEPLISENEEIMKKLIEGDFRKDFEKSKKYWVLQYLRRIDAERRAWMNEDPVITASSEDSSFSNFIGPNNKDYDSVFTPKTVDASSLATLDMNVTNFVDTINSPGSALTSKIKVEYIDDKSSGSLELTFLSSDETSCMALDQNDDKWIIAYEWGVDNNIDSEKTQLESLKFMLKNLTNGMVIDNCKLKLLSHTIS